MNVRTWSTHQSRRVEKVKRHTDMTVLRDQTTLAVRQSVESVVAVALDGGKIQIESRIACRANSRRGTPFAVVESRSTFSALDRA